MNMEQDTNSHYLDVEMTLQALGDGLAGLGQIVFGLVEVASHSEVSGESLNVIMAQLYEYADMAGEAADTMRTMREAAS